jgi:glutamate-ammonia-ligase adenylyltransferase
VDALSASDLPPALATLVENRWRAFSEAGRQLPKELEAGLPCVWAGSDFVAEQMVRDQSLVDWLAHPHRLDASLAAVVWQQQVADAMAPAVDEASLMQVLRQLRQRQMCRIIWRDLAGQMKPRPAASLINTVSDLSLLAQSLIDAALSKLMDWACQRYGVPTDANGEPVKLVVLAMGKLGARELNLSSDIDLIFAYEHEGEIAESGLDHHQFFVRLSQQLIRVLDQVTPDGFVFRVDMRLRPWGSSGALAIGFDAMEGYYEQQGREWERYALIKMRPVAGDLAAGERLVQRLTPFVYRRYIDYGAFQHLRDMKTLIEREVRRHGTQNDIKLGAGGIREVEFIVQAFQLIRGGQLPVLREPNLLVVLPLLQEHGLLSTEVVSELREAYVFLRNVEHRLQAVADRQTQRLPEDDEGRERLAFSMGCTVEEFVARLGQYRSQIRRHFANVIADSEQVTSDTPGTGQELTELWQGKMDAGEADQLLSDIGVSDGADVMAQLATFRDSRAVANMQPLSRERLDKLMPRLLETLAYQGQGGATLARLLAFLEAVLRRSAYMALLLENPVALTQLVKLSAASPFIADRLAQYPVLLDELLNVHTLYSPPPKEQLEDELHQHLLRLPEKDLEQQMDALRTFKQAHLLRVAACEVTQVLPLMKVSDYLTWLAEAVLEEVVQLAWDDLVEKHGTPVREDGRRCAPDFVVLGYGKLGGIELGHTSDLDIVFLHDSAEEGQTDGEGPLANEQFFARLGQRIIHILTTRTLSGPLYDVDIRLRPSGASGLLVTSLHAFARYQREQAWVWEQQALVRARPVAGDLALGKRFEKLRHDILCQERDPAQLKKEVLAMRERMHASLDRPREAVFHLKQDAGGIVDIEFMVQYGVLRWAYRHPELTAHTDNVRLLETLAAQQLMSAQDAGLLREAYLAFRSATHTQSLGNEPACVPLDRFRELREGVQAVWARWFQ